MEVGFWAFFRIKPRSDGTSRFPGRREWSCERNPAPHPHAADESTARPRVGHGGGAILSTLSHSSPDGLGAVA